MVGILGPLAGLFATQRAQRWLMIGGGLLGVWLWSQWWIARVEERAQRELEIYLAKKAAEVNREVRVYEQELDRDIDGRVDEWYLDELQRGWAAQPFAGQVIGESVCGDAVPLPDCAPSAPE